MKLKAPDIAADLREVHELAADMRLESAYLDAVDMANRQMPGMIWEEVRVIGGVFVQANLNKLQMMDVEVNDANWTAADCADGSLLRVTIGKTRMDGVNMSKSVVKDVVFRGCKLDIANFRFARLQRVRFEDCSLVEADFMGAEFREVEMVGCTIERTVFDRVKVASLDLRSSQISSLSGWRDLKGAVVSETQVITAAMQLVAEIGLKVE